MQSMRRLSLHNHMKIEQRRKRYSTSRSPPPFSSILDNQLFKSKVLNVDQFWERELNRSMEDQQFIMQILQAGVAYIVSFIGCLAYNYITFAKNTV